MNALSALDSLLHRLGIPHKFWWRICDAHDLALGVPDTPQNFPRRHGYFRLQHIYTGASGYPNSLRCRHCGKSMDDAGPCILVRGSR